MEVTVDFDALDDTIANMHQLFTSLLNDCAEAREKGGFYQDCFDELVTNAMDSVIKTKQALSVRMRREMGMEGEGASN